MSVIKVKIHEATGMPAGKQKLQYEVNYFAVKTCTMIHDLVIVFFSYVISNISTNFDN